jgi:hypothetical protein
MEVIWSMAGYAILILVILAGLIMTPLGLPGNWVILGCGVAYGLATDWGKFGWLFIALLVAAAVVGEIVEAVSSALGARKFGASAGAMVAAIVGSIVGIAVGTGILPLIGTLAGAFLGAFLGAFIYEYIRLQDKEQALRAGIGAFLGRTASVIAKGAIGVAMAGALVYQMFA